MSVPIADELYAQAIGWEVLNLLRREEGVFHLRAKEIEGKALKILEEIRDILDDEALNDPECFQRIESIVKIFYMNNISTIRHDWG